MLRKITDNQFVESEKVDQKLYCFCKSIEDKNRDMVACDKYDDWFHLTCVKLKKIPKTKTWYCPRKDNRSDL